MKQIVFQLETLTCPSCIRKIEAAMQQMPGVTDAKVRFHASKVAVTYEERAVGDHELSARLTQLGYRVIRSSMKELTAT